MANALRLGEMTGASGKSNLPVANPGERHTLAGLLRGARLERVLGTRRGLGGRPKVLRTRLYKYGLAGAYK